MFNIEPLANNGNVSLTTINGIAKENHYYLATEFGGLKKYTLLLISSVDSIQYVGLRYYTISRVLHLVSCAIPYMCLRWNITHLIKTLKVIFFFPSNWTRSESQYIQIRFTVKYKISPYVWTVTKYH